MGEQQAPKNDPFQKYAPDQSVERRITALVEKHKISPIELLANFPIYTRRVTLKRVLAYYDLYRQTIGIPGDIIELGIFRGNSLMMFANFLEAREIGNRTKKVIGFDNFEGFKELTPEDGGEVSRLQKQAGGFSPKEYYEELVEAIDIFDSDRFIPFKKRVELVVGDVERTVPKFVEEHPGLRISILHLDIDLYRPTMIGLKHLYPLVVRGGLVLFDEYAITEWSGESKAADEFFADKNVRLRNLPWTNSPGAYLVKP
jgi:hypothetical protein